MAGRDKINKIYSLKLLFASALIRYSENDTLYKYDFTVMHDIAGLYLDLESIYNQMKMIKYNSYSRDELLSLIDDYFLNHNKTDAVNKLELFIKNTRDAIYKVVHSPIWKKKYGINDRKVLIKNFEDCSDTLYFFHRR